MVLSREMILNELKDISTDEKLSNVQIGLFGSYARNTFNKRSDIDIVFKVLNDNLDTDELEVMWFIEDHIKDVFHKSCDVANYNVLKARYEEINADCIQNNRRPMDSDSLFSTLERDVIWIGKE